MDKEKKAAYLDAFIKLMPLIDEIANKRSGESWWSPPGEDWYYVGDTGYALCFIDQLKDWLEGTVDQTYTKPNSRLRNPPEND